ncbi:MAG: anthranilate phosphoribosyltransferase [Alphaproteobacteria bacterium]|nr:anthranilate phosphoribosyltransferase [Alphaproteobacteria bacterium]
MTTPVNTTEWQDFIAHICDADRAIEDRATMLAAITPDDVTGDMLAACAGYLLSKAVPLSLDGVDVCGTGGDKGAGGIKTFNVSTASAFVVAAAGMTVVKHGNRAVSSQSGSSDVLAALGVPVSTTAEEAATLQKQHNLCFIAAPAFHPVLAAAAPVRKSLGRATFFNLLGPLCNPARTKKQVIGVYDERFLKPMAEAARALGKTDVLLAHGSDGLDEISICAPTHIARLKDGEIKEEIVTPESLDITPPDPESLAGGDARTNAKIIESILSGTKGPAFDLVAVNAGAALCVAGGADTLGAGMQKASETILSGAALNKLNNMRGSA